MSELQDFKEHALDNPLICWSKTLTEKNIAVKDLKDTIIKFNFEDIELSNELDMKEAKKYQVNFFEEIHKYDEAMEMREKRPSDYRTQHKATLHQMGCMKAYKKFCDKYNNGWKKYSDMQLIYLKMYGELSSRKWLDTDGN